MSITIQSEEAAAILADLAARTHRPQPDLLLDLLRRERARLEDETQHRIAAGLEADEALRRKLNMSPVADPRPIDEILAWDEYGLPV